MEMRDRIKAIRNDAGLTQSEFSIRLGFAPTSAASWEKKDAQEPSEPIKLLICKTFGIREEWLKTGEGEMKVYSNVDFLDKLAKQHNLGPGATALLRATAQAYAELDEKTCAIVINKMFASLQEYIQQNQADLQMRSQVIEESPESDAASQ